MNDWGTLEELAAANMELERKLLQQAAQLQQARAENRALRKAVRRQRPGYSWLAGRAEVDAKGLLSLQLAGIQPSRRNAARALGMSARRWEWARALARLAGVHDGLLFHDEATEEIIRRLQQAAATAAKNPVLWRSYK